MKIYFKDQHSKFKQHLHFLKSRKVMAYDKSRLTEKITTIDIATNREIDQLDLNFLFDYRVFPETILTAETQWNDEQRAMQPGDTIVQQVYLPPTRLFSQKIIVGVRIKEVIDLPGKRGFNYETLEGHVEKGISTFTVEEIKDRLIFKIHTFSTPGNLLTKLIAPLFSIPYQTFCTKSALRHVKQQLERQSNH